MEIAFLRDAYIAIVFALFFRTYSHFADTRSALKAGENSPEKRSGKLSLFVDAIYNILYYIAIPAAFFYAIYVVKIDYALHRGEAKAQLLYIIEFYTLALALLVVAADLIIDNRKRIASNEIYQVGQLALTIVYKVLIGYLFYWYIILYSPWPTLKREQEFDGLWIPMSPQAISHLFVLSSIIVFCGSYFYYKNESKKREI